MFIDKSFNEQRRLAALHDLDVLDTAPEAIFDGIVQLAASLFEVPTALISLVDANRQWFKAREGMSACETARDISFCTHTLERGDILEVVDATLDPQFCDNPLVVEEPNIRYYAGQPLDLGNGRVIGTLCLIDYRPREALDETRREHLRMLGDQVVELMKARRLREFGRIWHRVSETLSDAIILTDDNGKITFGNRAASEMFGEPCSNLEQRDFSLLLEGKAKHRFAAHMNSRSASHSEQLGDRSIEGTGRRMDGGDFPIELSLTRWTSQERSQSGYAAIIRDISRRKNLQAERAESRAFLNAIVENLPSMLFVKNAQTRTYEVFNRASEKVTGLSRSEVIGRTDEEIFPRRGDRYRRNDDEVIASGGSSVLESDLESKQGPARRLRTKRVFIDHMDREPFILGIADDVTDRHVAHQKIAHLAMHDPLTGLRNRTGIEQDFESMRAPPDVQEIAMVALRP